MLTVKALQKPLFQQQPDFSCITTGKCIIAGEHAVLRGAPALVVPIKSRFLNVQYWNKSEQLAIHVQGNDIIEEQLKLKEFFEYAFNSFDLPFQKLSGTFLFDFHIPLASGLGASACIAVAFARWLLWRGLIHKDHVFKAAHIFENFFHGSSSGVDVAAVLYGKPLLYQKNKGFEIVEPTWMPTLFLSATGKASKTAEAIAKVLRTNKKLPCKGSNFDFEMAESVRLVKHSLMTVPHMGFSVLKEALNKAHHCFQAWGLTRHKIVKTHLQKLQAMGAVAFKPTGAGNGGYVLSLWEQPPLNPPFEMIQVF